MPAPDTDVHLFVSYARADNATGWVTSLVERLAGQFLADGSPEPLRPFFDKDSIREGRGWEDEILTGLRVSRAFLAILSPHYFASAWCRREWAWWTRHEMHRHCLRDGAAPIYYLTIDGFPAPRPPEQIAAWIVAQNLRPDDPEAQDQPDIERTVRLFLPRQAYDLRPFDAQALARLAETALQEKLQRLSAHVRELLARAAKARKSATDLPDYNPAFTGRVDDLIALRRDLALGAAGITAVVHGLGGIGKTELALAYAHAYAHEYPGGRFLLPCAGAADWRGALDRFAALHGWTFADEVRRNADLHFTLLVNKLHEFAEQRGRCLLLCDNVDSPELLRPGRLAQLRIRDDRFHLLFTTRLPQPPDAGAIASLHWRALDSLPHEDAVHLLETIVHACPAGQRPILADLARELGGFTIAVELTGRYLAGHPAALPAALLARLRAAALPELGDRAARTGPDLFRHGEEARLDFILGQTLATLSPAEICVLEYAAQLAPDAVPLDFVRAMLAPPFGEFARERGPVADAAWAQLIGKLSSLRLLMRKRKTAGPGEPGATAEVDPSDPVALASMHRLVQEVLRQRCGPALAERQQRVETHIKTACLYFREHWQDTQFRWFFPVLEATADAWLSRCERGEVSLVPNAGFVANDAYGVLDRVAEWSRAEPLLRRTIALLEKHFGPDHPGLAPTLNNLGRLCHFTNRLTEAEPLLRRALAIAEQSSGSQDGSIAVYLNNLASLLQDMKRHGDAEPLVGRVVSLFEKVYGKDDEKVGVALNNQAVLLRATGCLAESEPLLARVVQIFERAFNPGHPQVAAALNNHAQVWKALGKLDAAEPLMRRALAIDERVYEGHHPDVAGDLRNLAALLQETGRLPEAEPLLRRALAIDEKFYDRQHPVLARDFNNLGRLLEMSGRVAEAEPLLRGALVIVAKATVAAGHDHPDLDTMFVNYFGVLGQMGHPGEEALQRALGVLKECGVEGWWERVLASGRFG